MSFDDVRRFLESLLGEYLRAKWILSLAGARLGVIAIPSVTIGAIGQGLALVHRRPTKHVIKQCQATR